MAVSVRRCGNARSGRAPLFDGTGGPRAAATKTAPPTSPDIHWLFSGRDRYPFAGTPPTRRTQKRYRSGAPVARGVQRGGGDAGREKPRVV